MERLGLTNIQQTTTVLHLAYQYFVRPKGIIEDIVISVVSWEYDKIKLGSLSFDSGTTMAGHY